MPSRRKRSLPNFDRQVHEHSDDVRVDQIEGAVVNQDEQARLPRVRCTVGETTFGTTAMRSTSPATAWASR